MTSPLPPVAYPPSPVGVNHTAPVPRRVRAVFDGTTLVDTLRATYVWENPNFPQFYVPEADVDRSMIGDPGTIEDTDRGPVRRCDVIGGNRGRGRSGPVPGVLDRAGPRWDVPLRLAGHGRLVEEDEEVFGHPRSPYVRIDALRSTRHVRVEKEGVELAETDHPVALFETGIRTRWYLDRTAVRWEHLEATDTRTRCPYKGITSNYWSAARRRHRPPRCGLGLRLHHPGGAPDRRSGVLLRRAGRRDRRVGAPVTRPPAGNARWSGRSGGVRGWRGSAGGTDRRRWSGRALGGGSTGPGLAVAVDGDPVPVVDV